MTEHEDGLEAFVDQLLAGLHLPEDLAAEARADYLAHLRQDVEREVAAGLSREQAVSRAITALGSVEELRGNLGRLATHLRRTHSHRRAPRPDGGLFVSSLVADVRYAVRSLIKNPGLSLVVIATIALGIGGNTAVFTVVNGVLLSRLPYSEPGTLVRIWPEKVLSETMLTDLRERTSAFDGISAYRPVSLTLLREDDARVVDAMLVAANHFAVLRVAPVQGRVFEEAEQWAGRENVVLLSYQTWQSRFGGRPDIIGQSIRLGGFGYAARTVIGVMPSDYRAIVGSPEAWIPLSLDPDSPAFAGAYGQRALARLRSGVSIERARAEVAGLVEDFTETHPTQFRQARFSPIDVVPLEESIVRDIRPTLVTLLGAVGFVLLIACSNVANLLLARAVARRREAAIRIALGARMTRIVRQQLTESCVLALLGAGAGMALGSVLLSVLMDQIPRYVPRADAIAMEPRVLAFTLVAAVVSALLFGAAPAYRAATLDAHKELVGGDRTSTHGRRRLRLNNVLVIGEVALAVVLVTGSGLLVRSLILLNAVDAGFEPERILAVGVSLPAGRYDEPAARRQYFDGAFTRIGALPGVEAVGGINLLPLSGGNSGIPYTVEGKPMPAGTPSIVGNFRVVTPGHFEVFGITLKRGRMLQPTDVSDGDPVALINETLARRHWDWPQEDPTGTRLLDSGGNPLLTIVGVVSDIHQQSLAQEPRPEFYVYADQFNWQLRQIVVSTTRPAQSLLKPVVDAVRAVDAEVPIVREVTMDQVLASSLGSARFFVRLFSSFAILGLALAIIGVYGVMSYTMRQRMRELAIRVALGANHRQVLWFAIRQAMLPVLLGIALGTGLGLALTRFVSTQLLYKIPPHDPLTFSLVAVVLAGVGALASFVPARRASRVDPRAVLVQE